MPIKEGKVVQIDEPYLTIKQFHALWQNIRIFCDPRVIMACRTYFRAGFLSIHPIEFCTNIDFCSHFPLQYFCSFRIKYVQKGKTTHESTNSGRKYTQFTITNLLLPNVIIFSLFSPLSRCPHRIWTTNL